MTHLSPQNLLFLFSFPVIGAALGWLTNRLAITLLFRPRRAVRLGPLHLQGLIPRRQNELASRIGQIVEEELLNRHLIREEIARIDFEPYMRDFSRRMVRQRLAPRLLNVPVLGNLLNDRLLNHLERIALESLRSETEPMLRQLASEVESHLAFRRIVEDRIRSFPLPRLEQLLRSLAHREFHRIELLGGLIGLFVGSAQSLLLLLATLLT